MRNKLLFLLLFPIQLFAADVALQITLHKSEALVGDTVNCTISFLNQGKTNISNAAVQVIFSPLLKVFSPKSDLGIFDNRTNLWEIQHMANSQMESRLQVRLIVKGEGPLLISAEVLRLGEPDTDSSPGNNVLTEDDMAYTCVSVPIVFCGNEPISLTAEAFPGFSGYQWKYEGEPIPGATSRTYNIREVGHYACSAENTLFSFPVVVRKAMAFTVELGETQTICAGEKLRLTAQPIGGQAPYTYEWSNNKGLPLSKALKAGEELILSAKVRDAQGCVAKDSMKIIVEACK